MQPNYKVVYFSFVSGVVALFHFCFWRGDFIFGM